MRKVFKYPWRMCGKHLSIFVRIHGTYLSVYGEYGKLGLFWYTKLSPKMRKVFEHKNMWKESVHTWRRCKKRLGALGEYAKRHKSVYISINNNMNFKIS